MIEVLLEDRCIKCNQCVSVCPMNVFERVEDGFPRIARKSDCQSCFMCELYCPEDALYVEPEAEWSVRIDPEELERSGLLGGYREKVGWGPGRTPVAQSELIYQLSLKTNF